MRLKICTEVVRDDFIINTSLSSESLLTSKNTYQARTEILFIYVIFQHTPFHLTPVFYDART